MARPILIAVDDDSNVLEAVVQDLRRRFGAEYRVMRAASGLAALDTLAQLHDRHEPVALLLSDQRMPGMSGVDFLERSRALYPDARRVLLTAYADTEAAIQAINSARIHYYLSKPWDPPEEKLYPVLVDLLEDWQAAYIPPFEGLRVIGNRWSLRDHRVRNFLSRNHVPYRWLDIASNDEAVRLLEEHQLDARTLPVVLFADGAALVDPEPDDLAARVGLSTQAAQDFYDMIVVGAGPAGLAAAVYGASEGLRTLVIEPEAPGGQAGSTSRIENYLGFPSGITGADLGPRAERVRRAGAFVRHGALHVGEDLVVVGAHGERQDCEQERETGYHRRLDRRPVEIARDDRPAHDRDEREARARQGFGEHEIADRKQRPEHQAQAREPVG